MSDFRSGTDLLGYEHSPMLIDRTGSLDVRRSYACSAWKHSSKVKHGRRLFLSTFTYTQNDF